MCTLEKLGNLFILTLTGDDEHRLNLSLIDSIKSALDRVTAEATGSSALITTAQGKFFSNGVDLTWALSDPSNYPLINSKLKVKSPVAWRDVVMRGTKLTADMAIEQGIVDSAHQGAAETMKEAIKLGEVLMARKWDGKVYAHNRKLVFSDVLLVLNNEIVSKL